MAEPVGIGEAIGKGLDAAKQNYVPLLIGSVITLALFYVVIGILCMPGLYWMALKAVRGQKPEIGDLFIAFKEKLVDHLIMSIIAGIGFIACCVGVVVTQGLFFQGTFLLLDKKANTWGEAKDKCMAEVKPALVAWIILWFVCMLVGGILACLTWPIGFCAIAYAYDKHFGGGGEKAAA